MYFGNSAFLWALLLLAIPIIIHLVRLRRLKVIRFSSFKFLRKTTEQGAKPKKLMRYLILASRCLAFFCLVLAFALPSCNNNFSKTGRKVVGIYFDNSLSMAGQEGDPLVFNKNKEYVRGILRALPESTEVKFITQSSFGGVSNSLSVNQAEEALDQVKPSNLSEPMSTLLKRLVFSMDKESGAEKEVFIVSDFQKGSLGNLALVNLDDKKVHAYAVSMGKVNNLSVDTAWIQTPVLLKGETMKLKFGVRNNSKKDVNNVPVKLVDKNAQLGMVSMSIPAQSKKISEFEVEYNHAFKDLSISLNDKGFSFDNRLFINPGKAPSIKVKQVGQRNDYVAKVLLNQEVFKVVQQNPDRLICDECASDEFKTKVLPFVENGGVAIVSLPSSGVGTEMAKFIGVKELKLKQGNFSISNKSLSHSFFRSVFKSIPQSVSLPPVSSYYSTGGNTGYAEPILSLNNGDAFFMKMKKGKGYIYISLSPFDRKFSTWVESALFLPTITQALLPTTSNGSLYGLLSDATPLALHTNLSKEEEGFILKQNKMESQATVSLGATGTELHVSNYIQEPGTYELIDKFSQTVLDRVAFNINRNESNTEAATEDFISAQVPQLIWHSVEESKDEIRLQSGTQESSGLWRLFIWLAAAFFAIEMVLVLLRQRVTFFKTVS